MLLTDLYFSLYIRLYFNSVLAMSALESNSSVIRSKGSPELNTKTVKEVENVLTWENSLHQRLAILLAWDIKQNMKKILKLLRKNGLENIIDETLLLYSLSTIWGALMDNESYKRETKEALELIRNLLEKRKALSFSQLGKK